jgi:5-hydroxyisourate hydrolase
VSLSTHVLDAARGLPAVGIAVRLERETGGGWQEIAHALTDADGRVHEFGTSGPHGPGQYRITFDTGAYFAHINVATFYPEVSVVFEVVDAGQHHHVPLLLSPFAYSTYRGS